MGITAGVIQGAIIYLHKSSGPGCVVCNEFSNATKINLGKNKVIQFTKLKKGLRNHLKKVGATHLPGPQE